MRYDGDTLQYFDEKDGLEGGRITGILEDKEGNVWFGSCGGLTKYDGKSFTNNGISLGRYSSSCSCTIIKTSSLSFFI
jgi:ligand-binding sensor domain-containing protein